MRLRRIAAVSYLALMVAAGIARPHGAPGKPEAKTDKKAEEKGEEKAEEKADEKKEKLVDCQMTFKLKGWSAFYKTAKGEGVIRCDNGQTANVTLKATGGGITFGKSEVVDGTGKFSGVRNM